MMWAVALWAGLTVFGNAGMESNIAAAKIQAGQRPPIEVLVSTLPEQVVQSRQARKAFFATHELIGGEWKSK